MDEVLGMREATPGERRRFYAEEWNKRELPDFILHTLSLREFGFDYDGSGPSDRYNQFMTIEQLADFLRNKAPYAVYGSVALYEEPAMRKKWLKSELVFDVDAKDLPIKSCNCSDGKVCEVCLDEARQVAIMFAETLRSDLALRDVNFIYSGRGFHVRVTDKAAMKLGQTERGQIVEYVTGGVIPTDMTMALGYSKVFRDRLARVFEHLDERQLSQSGLRKALVRKLMEEKDKALAAIHRGRLEEIESFEGMGSKSFQRLLQFLTRLNLEFTDGKVTIDTKRILRLPSSLHSTVSMKCILVRDIERFSIDEAVPKFVRERRS
ncbi:MAG: DNA primase catalytic subunit PriS [Candidatus Hadarchaeota archaeon]|nr:DNA primase catalytic subunit PriS [Candidatus Hadarchaeota archaeon]